MEKLIKLLNEHRVELLHGNIQNKPMRHYKGYVFGLADLTEQNCILLVISKSYGFIKRLVDNDKIDRTYREDIDYPFYIDDTIKELKGYKRDEMIIMLLAISDTPIDLLISYLK